MAITDMQKVHMALHKSISDELVDKLQRLGCCQFIAMDQEKMDEKSSAPLRAKLRKVDELLGDVRFVSRFLEPYATEKGSAISRAMGGMPSCSLAELEALSSEEKFSAILDDVRSLEKRLSNARAGMSRVRGLISQVQPLSGIPFDLELYNRGTERIQGSLLMLQKTQTDALKSAASSRLGGMVDVFTLPVGEKETVQTVSLLYPKELAAEVQELLAGYQVTRIDVPSQLRRAASEELSALTEELDELIASESSVVNSINEVANDYFKTSQYCSDFWGIQKSKLDSMITGEQTDQIMLISLWIPKNRTDLLRACVAGYEALSDVAISDPGEDDNPPVLLCNSGIASPLEPLTTMYGSPTYGTFDPTTIMAPFFYLFFGMCFGDAGYGLLLSSLLMFIMVKKNVTGTLQKFFKILIIGNLAAVAFGAVTFSWFGDSITNFPFLGFLKPLQSVQILDPMNDPMTMLYISLALGFIQIMVGLVIAMMGNLKSGDTFAAFADQGGWMIFLIGLVMVGLSSAGTIPVSTNISAVIASAGALILVATQGRSKEGIGGKLFSGILSLYNVTGYLGDVLSYSRLLALGLGSAAVGMVINLLAKLVAGAPYVGIIFAALIFVLGHLFSIAVNILGAFIHSLRLQYVEFFGKFYDSNGEEFRPLAFSTQYVKISEATEH